MFPCSIGFDAPAVDSARPICPRMVYNIPIPSYGIFVFHSYGNPMKIPWEWEFHSQHMFSFNVVAATVTHLGANRARR